MESRFLELLTQLAHDDAALDLLDYAPADGAERYRQAAAAWLTRTAGFTRVEARDLVLCAGATQGVTLALQSVAAPGDTVLCEAATFFGFKSIAERLRITLVGVAMDEEGVDPDALARAAAETGARVALLIPTLHNPTTRSCSRARRQALAELARRQDLTFVEDDVYAAYARGRNAAPPLAALAPERSWYVNGASKTLAPGLRAGWILPPREARETLVRTMRALNASAPIFGHLVFAKLVRPARRSACSMRSSPRRGRAPSLRARCWVLPWHSPPLRRACTRGCRCPRSRPSASCASRCRATCGSRRRPLRS